MSIHDCFGRDGCQEGSCPDSFLVPGLPSNHAINLFRPARKNNTQHGIHTHAMMELSRIKRKNTVNGQTSASLAIVYKRVHPLHMYANCVLSE